jgi:hypothetical protein
VGREILRFALRQAQERFRMIFCRFHEEGDISRDLRKMPPLPLMGED